LKNKANVADLKDLSRVARMERAKLQRQLQLVRNGEDTLNTKIANLRSTVQASHAVAKSNVRLWPRWIWAILLIEAIVFWIVLRYVIVSNHWIDLDQLIFALKGSPLSVQNTFS
jgi:hypothetical protein